MLSLLLINNDTNDQKNQKKILERELNASVVYKDSIENCLNIIELMPDLSAIIICNPMYQQPSLEKLSDKIKGSHSSCKILLPCDSKTDGDRVQADNIQYTKETLTTKSILLILAKSFNLLLKSNTSEHDDSQYSPIDIKNLLHLQIAPCDIFIKIYKKDGVKYLLRFKGNEGVDHSRVRKYIENDLSKMYVSESDILVYKNHISADMMKRLEFSCLSTEKRGEDTKRTYDFLLTDLKNEGFTARNIEITDAVIHSINKISSSIKNSSRIKKHLDLLFSDPNSDPYIHNQLIAVISTAIINKTDWGNEQHIEKLTYAAMFHDLEIMDRPDLIELRNYADVERKDPSSSDLALIENHARNSSLFMQDFPDLPLGVESIILQHHGNANGIGFAEKINPAKLSKLTLVFLIAESFVHILMKARKLKSLSYLNNKEHEDSKVAYIIDKLEKDYTNRAYQDIMTALKLSFNN
jgi:hypothetical protein